MSITDELREWLKSLYTPNSATVKDEGERIADRIDAEHERAMADAYLSGTPTDEKLTELGWIRLPKDADGEYIHVGDEVEWRHSCGSCELRHGIVTGIKTDKIGDEVFYEVAINADRFAVRLMSNQLRHYHAPTVEDVLREFTDEVWNRCCEGATASDSGIDELVAECAAKLRLAGENA